MNPPERPNGHASLERPGHARRRAPPAARRADAAADAADPGRRGSSDPARSPRPSRRPRRTWSPSSGWASRRPTCTGSSSKARTRPSRRSRAARAAAAADARTRSARPRPLRRDPTRRAQPRRPVRRRRSASRRRIRRAASDPQPAAARPSASAQLRRSRAASTRRRRSTARSRRCSRSSPRRRATRPRCSTWTCSSTPTWASTRSSASRSSPRSRSGSPSAPVIEPEHLGTLRTLATDRRVPRPRAAGQRRPHGRRPAPSARPRPAIAPASCWRSVAEKTGYPAEMLEPDMQLDADLGIDSIKRVEILSALQERLPEMPPVEPEHLGTLRTLARHRRVPRPARGRRRRDAADRRVAGHAGRTSPGDVAVARDPAGGRSSEKTGYPAEMLELDMQLDADLGIDSIKRVEILSAVQERLPEAPVDQARAPRHAPHPRPDRRVPRAPIDPARRREPGRERPGRRTRVVDGEADPRRAATSCSAAWSPGRCRSTRRATRGREARARAATIWITDDGSPLTAALRSELGRAGFRPRVIAATRSASSGAGRGLCGLIVLAPAGRRRRSSSPTPSGCSGPPARRCDGRRSEAARSLADRLAARRARSASRGSGPRSTRPRGGWPGWPRRPGTSGPRSTARRSTSTPASTPAERAAGGDRRRAARARAGRGRPDRERAASTLELVAGARVRHSAEAEAATLGPGDVVVISGGARGITAEVAVALADAFRPRLSCSGRSPAPEARARLARGLLATRPSSSGHLLLGPPAGRSPQAIGEQFRQILADREIRRNLDRIEAAGSRVVYRSVDVRDRAAVRGAIDAGSATSSGRSAASIHGAGVLADRRIEDQTDDQFALVYDTKVAGLHALLDAIEPDALRVPGPVLVVDGPVRPDRPGRLRGGQRGPEQVGPAARPIRLPDCRVVSFNWGPWDGGMVTRRSGRSSRPRGSPDPARGRGPHSSSTRSRTATPAPGRSRSSSSPSGPAADAATPPAPSTARGAGRRPQARDGLRAPGRPEAVPVLPSHVIDGQPSCRWP